VSKSLFVKKLLLPLIAGCGLILPFTQLQATEFADETFGGFAAGKEFTLTVTERLSIKTVGSDVTRHVPIPRGMPDFRKGQKVNFIIGRRGQLKGPGFSITFKDDERRINFYSINPSGFSSEGSAATVTKTAKRDRPTGASLTFYQFRFSGFKPVTSSVSYLLE
jgi:hypothetical protein